MEELTNYISVGKDQLAYYTIGQGDNYIICFHGFDEGKEVFENWLPSFGQKYTMICFDLPAHGESSSFFNHVIEPSEIKSFVSDLKQAFEIESFDVLAFSIGSRIGFSILDIAKDSIGKAYFYAPDGIVDHGAYKMAVRNFFGRFIFEYAVHHPMTLLAIARVLFKYKFLSIGILRYLEKRWVKTSLREKLYNTWNAVPKLAYNVVNDLPMVLVFGEMDTIVRPELARKFESQSNIETFVLPFGHQLIIPKLNDWNRSKLGLD